MIDQLFPDFDVHITDIQITKFSGVHQGLCNKIRQKRDHIALGQQGSDDVGSADFQYWGDVDRLFRQFPVQNAPVSLAVFCKDKGFSCNIPDGQSLDACISGIGIGYEVHGQLLLFCDDIVLVIGMSVQCDDEIRFIVIQHIKHHIGIRGGETDGNEGILD